MDLLSFWLGAEYGKSDKKGKRRILAFVGIVFLVFLVIISIVIKEYLFSVIAIILSLFLYLKFVRGK